MTPAAMPPDFVMYTVIGSALVGGALVAAGAVVVVAIYAARRWWRRRNRDVYAERQGRRDGYVGIGLVSGSCHDAARSCLDDDRDAAQGLEKLIADGHIEADGDRWRWRR